MAKQYLETDVLEAAKERLRYVFGEFEQVYLSFSAGKDSGVMLHLALAVMEEVGRTDPLDVLLVDLEAQYKETIAFASRALDDPRVRPHWVCLPLNLRNSVSQLEPYWLCWDPAKKDQWVRPLPKRCYHLDDHPFGFFQVGMEFEQFVPKFGEWLADGRPTACLVGIRSDESLNRYRTIVSSNKRRYQGLGWSTKVTAHVYNFYPLYDWRTEDIWVYNGDTGADYNRIYDLMHLAGRGIHNQRICQPYGDDQRQGLDLFAEVEPETWGAVVARVAGANYGALYCGDSLLGNGKVALPPGHTWETYCQMLLNSLPPRARTHYGAKMDAYFGRLGPEQLASQAQPHLWRRIAKMILRNDWSAKSLSTTATYAEAKQTQNTIRHYHDTL